MSATLTWANSGLGVKSGVTNQAVFDDLDTLVTAQSANAAFTWQTAGKNSVGASPLYYVLSPKGGANGRILFINWTSAPAANNVTILDQAPALNTVYIAYFPNGTANTPSNLTAASGTIMGSDVGCTKVQQCGTVATVYAANIQLFYFDSPEGLALGFQNPASSTQAILGAGNLVIDSADVVYPCVFGSATGAFGAGTSAIPWVATPTLAGAAAPCVRTNYGVTGSNFFIGFVPIIWANQATGPNDILVDAANNKTWFVPIQLLGQTKGQGFVLKFRQFGFGPGTVTAFAAYSTTGPVIAARQFNGNTVGGNGFAWFTNFKL